MVKGKFWKRTGFITRDFDEMIRWISVLNERKLVFVMTSRIYSKDGTWHIFMVNANSYVAEDLIQKDDFHDAFPIVDGTNMMLA
jgi:hypothetical protein